MDKDDLHVHCVVNQVHEGRVGFVLSIFPADIFKTHPCTDRYALNTAL